VILYGETALCICAQLHAVSIPCDYPTLAYAAYGNSWCVHLYGNFSNHNIIWHSDRELFDICWYLFISPLAGIQMVSQDATTCMSIQQVKSFTGNLDEFHNFITIGYV
jgi:hypothetical protein